jgi:hypothetical protein
VTGDSSFPIEEFINAVTSQLDRVQDGLRFKAVNRPLTYALKDFTLELQVFVEMDIQGNVRFRPAGPNESGASTVHLGFTTITKPMIEENTVSLALSRSPSLAEIGLAPEEQQRLEQFGVRNAAQLKRLGSSTGATTVARLSGIPVERLRAALQLGSPRLRNVAADGPVPRAPAPIARPPAREAAPHPPQVEQPPSPAPAAPRPSRPQPSHEDLIGALDPQAIVRRPLSPAAPAPAMPTLRVASDTRRLKLSGDNLIGEQGPPIVRLNKVPLSIARADDNEILVEMPHAPASGALEIELPDGDVLTYSLSFHDDLFGTEAGDDDTLDGWYAPLGNDRFGQDGSAKDDDGAPALDPWSPGGSR